MALKESQRYPSLWQSRDESRGGMDASQCKDYALTLLFMESVSDKAGSAKGSLIDVPEGASLADMLVAQKGVIDQADFNDEGKFGLREEMQDRLSKLVEPEALA